MDLNATTLIGGGAAIGLLTAFWSQVRAQLNKLVGLLFVRTVLTGHTLKDAALIYMIKNYKCVKLQEKVFWGTTEYVRPNQRNELVGVEAPPAGPNYWYGNKSLVSVRVWDTGISIAYIRGTFDVTKFVSEAIEFHNKTKKNKDWKTGYDRYRIASYSGSIGNSRDGQQGGNKQTIGGSPDGSPVSPAYGSIEGTDMVDNYRTIISNQELRYDVLKPLHWTKDQLGQPKKDSAVSQLSLKQTVLDAVEEALRWRESEDWFKQRCIPWKRGWCCYGDPGTGKTAFIRALAQELNMPIATFDLSTMTNQDFTHAWEQAMSNTPCIALIEDIDAIFDGRKNIAAQGLNQGLSFDCLLNTIDGVQNSDGMFLIITTNNIEKLDPALGNPMANGNGAASMSTRPGRIDRAIRFEHLDDDGRTKMAKRIFEGMQEEKWKTLLSTGDKDTGAQFQERCCRLALKMFWEK